MHISRLSSPTHTGEVVKSPGALLGYTPIPPIPKYPSVLFSHHIFLFILFCSLHSPSHSSPFIFYLFLSIPFPFVLVSLLCLFHSILSVLLFSFTLHSILRTLSCFSILFLRLLLSFFTFSFNLCPTSYILAFVHLFLFLHSLPYSLHSSHSSFPISLHPFFLFPYSSPKRFSSHARGKKKKRTYSCQKRVLSELTCDGG